LTLPIHKIVRGKLTDKEEGSLVVAEKELKEEIEQIVEKIKHGGEGHKE